MQVEATGKPIRYRLRSGKEVVLHPGVPTELPDQAAKELLMKAAGKVREVVRVTDMVIEPVENIKPVFWLSDGRIIGPGHVVQVAKCTEFDGSPSFWLCVEFHGSWAWISEKLLRNKQTFEAQR